ncbi:hypothetical protein C4580_01200 [Candidatus Woesearchaeota archaeon]|nr:MAG: hypothetical protein C4580_01200 [Candidatus Woesearchaeota archaeon]
MDEGNGAEYVLSGSDIARVLGGSAREYHGRLLGKYRHGKCGLRDGKYRVGEVLLEEVVGKGGLEQLRSFQDGNGGVLPSAVSVNAEQESETVDYSSAGLYRVTARLLAEVAGGDGRKYGKMLGRVATVMERKCRGREYVVTRAVLERVVPGYADEVIVRANEGKRCQEKSLSELNGKADGENKEGYGLVESLQARVRELEAKLAIAESATIGSAEFDDLCSRAEEFEHLEQYVRSLEAQLERLPDDEGIRLTGRVHYHGGSEKVPPVRGLYRVREVLEAYRDRDVLSRDEICAVLRQGGAKEISALRAFERFKEKLRKSLGIPFEIIVDKESYLRIPNASYWKARVDDLISVSEIYQSREWKRVAYAAARRGLGQVELFVPLPEWAERRKPFK